MTILYTLLVLLVTKLATTITSLCDLTIYSYSLVKYNKQFHYKVCQILSIRTYYSILLILRVSIYVMLHSEKNPARPILFNSTNYWQQF